jgi:K+-sensing histidine kinase KdpD
METLKARRGQLVLLAALACPLVLALILVPFRGSFTDAASALLFVAVIVAVAVAGNRFSGVVASLSSALWFDFFLTVPYQRLAISHRPDIETTVCIVVVGIIVTELAASNRRHLQIATEESDYVAIISRVAELAASAAPTDTVVLSASSAIAELLELRACRFDPKPSDRPIARLQPDGSIVHAGLNWPADQAGIPGPESEILVQWRGEVFARFILTPTPGKPVAQRPRAVAVAIADVVGAAVSGRTRVP